MQFEDLNQEDIKLIKDAMLENSVSVIAECQECRKVISEERYDEEMNRGKRLVYLVNVLNAKKVYDNNQYINIGVTIIKKDEKEIELTEEIPSHFSDNEINERLWDKYSDKYDIDEILWEEM